jgi:hypothetical protein
MDSETVLDERTWKQAQWTRGEPTAAALAGAGRSNVIRLPHLTKPCPFNGHWPGTATGRTARRPRTWGTDARRTERSRGECRGDSHQMRWAAQHDHASTEEAQSPPAGAWPRWPAHPCASACNFRCHGARIDASPVRSIHPAVLRCQDRPSYHHRPAAATLPT